MEIITPTAGSKVEPRDECTEAVADRQVLKSTFNSATEQTGIVGAW
jgi:hypothetical protein